MQKSPRLFSTTRTFRSGYGARAVDLSKDKSTFFVGCKDGSVIAFDLLRAQDQDGDGILEIRGGPDTGVRYLYACQGSNLQQGSLLAGDDLGQLIFLEWRGGKALPPRIVGRNPKGSDKGWAPVTFIADWGQHLLVAYRDHDARLLPREIIRGQEVDVSGSPVLANVQGVCGSLQSPGKGTLLICEDGMLWRIDPGSIPVPMANCCEEPEQPGFISDAAPVLAQSPKNRKKAQDVVLHAGLYTSTDTGVYLMRWPQDETADKPEIKKVHLPGFSGMCMAVSYARRGEFNFLWISDLAGDVRTFWSHMDDKEPLLYWLPFDFRLESSQAVRSIASFGPPEEDRFVICQACRNEKVMVTWYGDRPTKKNAAYLLAWGSLEELKAWKPESQSPELDWEAWSLEARLALCIEEAGTTPRELVQFLANPRSERLAWEVLTSLQDHERAWRAIELWTDALLGTIHRRLEQRREQQSLGVVRWLRRLHGCIPAEGTTGWAEWMRGLPPVIEDCIRHTRKWGVFGDTYSQVQEVFAPLVALEGQQLGDRPLDSIAYQTLLFSRKVDVEDEQPANVRGHLIAWDVRFLPSSREDVLQGLVAVSWGGSGIEIYRLEPRSEGIVDFIPCLTKLESQDLFRGASDRDETGREHSRSILLGTRETPEGPRTFILRCVSRVASGGGPRGKEHFELVEIDPASGKLGGSIQGDELPAGESVYTLKELEAGLVLVGFRGGQGSARIGLLRIGSEDLTLLPYDGSPDGLLGLRAAYPELQSININPVWSLDAARSGDGKGYEVVAGCADGQIWKFTIAVEGNGFKLDGEYLPVGRMSSAVRAVSYLPGKEHGAPTRVISGAADGTILAFQRLSPAASSQEAYATLWATREQEAVSRIFSFEACLGSGEEKTPLVIAVTQNGMAVLFSNLDAVEASPHGPDERTRLRRLHVPGERLGRFRLGKTSFASVLVAGPNTPEGEANAIKRGRVVRLLTVTGEGTLRLVTLNYPKYTALRREQFQSVWKAWREVLAGNQEGGAFQGYLLRRAEALLTAAPMISAIMVRWILWPDSILAVSPEEWQRRQEISAAPGTPGPSRQWIPRHFQPLVDVDAAWTQLRTAVAPEERQRLKAWLSESLTDALRAARKVRDSHLFKEIVEVILTRANHELFSEMMVVIQSKKKPEIHSDWFLAILSCLVRVRSEWLGAPESLDNRMRIVIVRNLVDGETLWSLSQAHAKASAHEQDWGTTPRDRIQQLIDSRVEQIQSFFSKGDPILSLEVLRAVNMALARTCRRLSAEDELSRVSIEGYYKTIGDFACRAVHSTHNELGEALTQEISRTYAFGILACSSSTLRLTHRMTEADLGIDLAQRVRYQFDLLEQVQGRAMPKPRLRIFEIASGLEAQREEGSYTKNLLTLDPNRRSIFEEDIGEDNQRLATQWRLFEMIVVWLHELSDQFSNEAEDVSLGFVFIFLDMLADLPEEDAYSHSRKFWNKALIDLYNRFPKEEELGKRRTKEERAHESRPHPVRPSLVLFSVELSKWCEDQRRELDKLKKEYRVFEPQRALYEHALISLQRAAASFQKGTALQKNMVLGVLGHGLLEMLDEHLLSLWEVAQTLDPVRTWGREDEEMRTGLGPNPSRAASFADDMLNTAVKAEVIPKNLRNLQWLLSYRSGGDPLGVDPTRRPTRERDQRNLTSLLEEFKEEHKWNLELTGQLGERTVREIHFLRFVLNELVDNEGHNPKTPKPPTVRVEAGQILLNFNCDPKKKTRLKEVKETSHNLQQPVNADKESCTRSHGMGLYLANLAAAAVGWSLEMGDLDKEPDLLPFILKRKG